MTIGCGSSALLIRRCNLLPLLIGAGLAVVLAIGARITRADQDRSFYPTILIVIAAYYVLFAFMSGEGIVEEIVVASVFSITAIAGGILLPMLVGVGILLHGAFDFLRPMFISNSGVPAWWPAFCGGVDILLGAWVIWLSLKRAAQKDTAAT